MSSSTNGSLNSLIEKSVFNIHDPKGIKYLFQLRMNLSPLSSHKKHHTFADTPSDIFECNEGIEDTRMLKICNPQSKLSSYCNWRST